MRLLRAFALVVCGSLSSGLPIHGIGNAGGARRAANTAPIYLIVRADDGGMSHSVNMALERLIETGMPVSVSVIFAAPWYQETVEILKRHPHVAVGVHLALNAEWKNYRWGPVSGRGAVPTLVDSEGYFFSSGEALFRNNPSLAEIEKELRAQIERAKRSGLKIDYVDYHMGTAVRTPETRAIVERLAREYGLGMSEYFGETRGNPQYAAAPRAKEDSLAALVARLHPGFNLLVTHIGIDGPELGALVDMNSESPLADMSKHRQGELDAITSPRFKDALTSRSVSLVTYRQVIEMQGLKSMHPPAG
ncbi:MAG TPA: ChbG/HpnK family deacetylase [Gemmatimonadaceae bacterium]|nr:ChbG/HpnK family deacetylase [Gemmatimonadaceae bacterium]